MITADLRRALLAAAGRDTEPLLVPGPAPGTYASSLPFRLGGPPRAAAARLAARLAAEPWIASAEVTGAGYLTVTVTHDALAGLAVRVARAGGACAASDALAGRAVPAPPEPDLAAEPGWPRARAALAAQLTARLAAAAGATLLFSPERALARAPVPPPPAPPEAEHPPAPLPPPPVPPAAAHPLAPAPPPPLPPAAGQPPHPAPAPPAPPAAPEPPAAAFPPPPARAGPVAEAIGYAGADAVRFALALVPPGGAAPRAAVIARHVLGNPAYAVRYAHAAAASVLRWAAELGTRPAGFQPRLLTGPGELALLDALSWLPERVAAAARRGRPDEFAGYLAELAARTVDTMSTTGFRKIADISSERLWLADAARTGLAAGLGLLGISAPSRM